MLLLLLEPITRDYHVHIFRFVLFGLLLARTTRATDSLNSHFITRNKTVEFVQDSTEFRLLFVHKQMQFFFPFNSDQFIRQRFYQTNLPSPNNQHSPGDAIKLLRHRKWTRVALERCFSECQRHTQISAEHLFWLWFGNRLKSPADVVVGVDTHHHATRKKRIKQCDNVLAHTQTPSIKLILFFSSFSDFYVLIKMRWIDNNN